MRASSAMWADPTTSTAYELRPAIDEDQPLLEQLMREGVAARVLDEEVLSHFSEVFRALIRHGGDPGVGGAGLRVLEADGRSIAFAAWRPASADYRAVFGRMTELWMAVVLKSERGRGHGRNLVQGLLGIWPEERELFAVCDPAAARMMEILDRAGFHNLPRDQTGRTLLARTAPQELKRLGLALNETRGDQASQ